MIRKNQSSKNYLIEYINRGETVFNYKDLIKLLVFVQILHLLT